MLPSTKGDPQQKTIPNGFGIVLGPHAACSLQPAKRAVPRNSSHAAQAQTPRPVGLANGIALITWATLY